ncbi:MAG: 50S ribosomal protein L10, partial [Dehalococcoidales bacterium]|nr:50S ribosomal protein L10 [Dehalococcoidales bacterium]
ISILTDYRGLTTSALTALRRKLFESGGDYRVVKNTLARFAAERAGQEELVGSLEGPIAIAFGYGDITVPAKVITEYVNTANTSLTIKGGFTGDRLLSAEEVVTLSKLPSREILLARVLGQMQSPISSLVVCLSSPLRGLAGVLQARIMQLEEK